MTTNSQVQSTLRRVLDDKRDMQWTLRPILHDMQDALGHVSLRTRLQ
jgi:hypothetical protein